MRVSDVLLIQAVIVDSAESREGAEVAARTLRRMVDRLGIDLVSVDTDEHDTGALISCELRWYEGLTEINVHVAPIEFHVSVSAADA